MKLLFNVENVFEISGRGCFILPGIRNDSALDFALKAGDRILIRKSDGSEIDTEICELEFADNLTSKRSWVAIRFPSDIRKSDVEIGCKVWLIERGEETL